MVYPSPKVQAAFFATAATLTLGIAIAGTHNGWFLPSNEVTQKKKHVGHNDRKGKLHSASSAADVENKPSSQENDKSREAPRPSLTNALTQCSMLPNRDTCNLGLVQASVLFGCPEMKHGYPEGKTQGKYTPILSTELPIHGKAPVRRASSDNSGPLSLGATGNPPKVDGILSKFCLFTSNNDVTDSFTVNPQRQAPTESHRNETLCLEPSTDIAFKPTKGPIVPQHCQFTPSTILQTAADAMAMLPEEPVHTPEHGITATPENLEKASLVQPAIDFKATTPSPCHLDADPIACEEVLKANQSKRMNVLHEPPHVVLHGIGETQCSEEASPEEVIPSNSQKDANATSKSLIPKTKEPKKSGNSPGRNGALYRRLRISRKKRARK